MIRTFNCGIGMIAVVAPDAETRITQVLKDHGETVHRIGGIVQRAADAEGCVVRNTGHW
jgi:phosphoribosylaminoimidazole (AIR) synthetase